MSTETPDGEALAAFHPLVRGWFAERFAAPTAAQAAGWPAIRAGRDTLISAPTGSGKTLAAFLAGVDSLIREADAGALDEGTRIVYVSPLKALGNDIQRNLAVPLKELRERAEAEGREPPPIRIGVRSGDTSSAERQALIKKPPHILITTPESLYLVLTGERGRATLRGVRTVIVDEIHALARDRRGSHLSLSLARLDHVVEAAGNPRPARIGLSATQKPIEEIATFLVGADRVTADGATNCRVVNLGHQRDLDLAIEAPPSELSAVAPAEQWEEIYDRLAELVTAHRTTLIFVNTRRMAERVAHHLAQRVGEAWVASHHGSLSRERRLRLEQRLKDGDLRALVATASLELGIDVGSIDLVCQLGSPRSITAFLQRVGRAGHALGARSMGRLFPLTRDDLVECAALVRAVHAGRLDRIIQPRRPLDVLAQQIVAECAAEEWREDDLYTLVRRAAPYRDLDRGAFEQILDILSLGVGEGAGRAAPLLHRDRINHVLRGRRGARLIALTNGGTIPELGDYSVIAEPDGTFIGTVNEDFAIESAIGDIFLLGSTSWRIKRVEPTAVRVEDAHGLPPTIPFWLGEAPGRTLELSEEVGAVRTEVAARLDQPGAAEVWLQTECGLDPGGALQLVAYLRATRDGLGIVPTCTDVVFERFFDEAGGMQLVVHAPFGARINRAWGLTLRKRFCVNFDFELQAAASDDAILLSLGPQHSFPLDDAFSFVRRGNATEALEQSILYVPLFPTRFRWDATRALAIPRYRGGRKVPPFIQRMRSDDLLAAVFPEQVGCQENLTGPLQIPDHVLVRQAVDDCLYEAMDLNGLLALLDRIEAGEVRLHARDTTEPSLMAHEIVNGRPFTFLDNAPLEERRTRAVSLRRGLPEQARDLGELDADAIDRVRDEAWPQPRDAEEVHDALLGLMVVAEDDAIEWLSHLDTLAEGGRAGSFAIEDRRFWFPAELRMHVELIYPTVAAHVARLAVPPEALEAVADREAARARLIRGQAEAIGPFSIAALARRVGLTEVDVARGIAQVEAGGFVLRGHFTPGLSADAEEYCDRRLLARIHRYTLDRLRREIDPVPARDFIRFLLRWHHVAPGSQLEGRGGVRQAIAQLAGFEAPAGAWERELLPARVRDYGPNWLDELCLAGEVAWARLTPKRSAASGTGAAATRVTPLAMMPRGALGGLLAAVRANARLEEAEPLGAGAEVMDLLRTRGALFFDELVNATRRLPSDVEQGLRVLIGAGQAHSDGFQGLRQLAGLSRRGNGRGRQRRRAPYLAGGLFTGGGPAGRWAAVAVPTALEDGDELAEEIALLLLQRYGVLFRDVLARESVTLPWRDLLRALRRLEARGVVRGGRFVSGFVGEQYALPEAVEGIRRVRRSPLTGERVSVPATDPLNLTGVILPGPRVPALTGRTVEYVDGMIAALAPERERPALVQ